jgi:hypothetical protein
MDQATLPAQGPPVRRIPVEAEIHREGGRIFADGRPGIPVVGQLLADAAGSYLLELGGWAFRYRAPADRDYTRCETIPPNQAEKSAWGSPANPFPDLRCRVVGICGGLLVGDPRTSDVVSRGSIGVTVGAGMAFNNICRFHPARGSGFRDPPEKLYYYATGQTVTIPGDWY